MSTETMTLQVPIQLYADRKNKSRGEAMTSMQSSPTGTLTVPLEQIARLIRRLDRRQKALLLRMVPELQTIPPEEVEILAEQTALLAYFDVRFAALSEARPLRDNDPFLGGLTVAEFFAAPEMEQARIWEQAHAEAVRALATYEHPVRANALPAR